MGFLIKFQVHCLIFTLIYQCDPYFPQQWSILLSIIIITENYDNYRWVIVWSALRYRNLKRGVDYYDCPIYFTLRLNVKFKVDMVPLWYKRIKDVKKIIKIKVISKQNILCWLCFVVVFFLLDPALVNKGLVIWTTILYL